MKYIPADKLIAEIERQQRRLTLLANTEQASVRRDCALQNGAYSYILGVITSLQQGQPDADLENAAQHVYESWMGGTMDDVRRDMVELGKVLNARKED